MQCESPNNLFGEKEKLIKRKRDYFDGNGLEFGLLKSFSSTEPKKQRSLNFMPKLDLGSPMDEISGPQCIALIMSSLYL
jgi:hypothetical protein